VHNSKRHPTRRLPCGFLVFLVFGAALALVMHASVNAQEAASAAKKSPSPTEALWVLDGIGDPKNSAAVIPTISIFQGKALEQKTGIVQSKRIFVNPAAGTVGGLAFDSSHNLWFSLCPGVSQAGYLIKINYSEINAVIDRRITSPSEVIGDPAPQYVEYLSCPGSIAFDQSGNLWVSVGANSDPPKAALIEYTATELAVSGEPTPVAVIATPNVEATSSIAFDSSGNLWEIGGASSTDSPPLFEWAVLELTAAQLAAGDQTDPYQILIVTTGTYPNSFWSPSSTIFDHYGNLWVVFNTDGNLASGGVEMFPASELTGEGTSTPVPAITINAALTKGTYDFSSLSSLAFDAAGDLWVGNSGQVSWKHDYPAGGLSEFAPTQVAASGGLVPIRMIIPSPNQQNMAAARFITFGPPLPQ